jgi:ABC-2 type transport system permease protein
MTALTGTGVMVRLILRRDRLRLPIWLLAIIGLVYVSAGAVQGLYDTPEAQATYARTVGNSGASIAMNGPPVALDTIGGITVFEVSATAIVGTALMAIFLVIRHTRADEEAGRAELMRAGVLGRHATTAAALLVVGVASTIVGAAVAASFLAVGLPASGSVLYGAAVAAVGWVFTGVALVAAQVTEHARGATGIALAALGVSYVVRALGDVGESWVSLLSPIGWSQQVRAFGDERWWPLGLSLLATVGLTMVASWVVSHRDVGAGLVAPRPGPATASARLAGPVGLAWRLQRASLFAWVSGMALLGVAFGSLGQEVEDLLDGNPELRDVIAQSGGASIVDAYFATVLMLSALIATGFTVMSVLRLRGEESGGRAEPLLATPLSRARWSLASLSVTLLGSASVMVVTGVAAGVTHAMVSGDEEAGWSLVTGALTYLPAVLVLGALAFALFGWTPAAATGVAWGVLAVCVVMGWLGEVLGLSDAVMDLSPYGRTPEVPMVDVSWPPVLGLVALALGLTALGSVGLRRRDVV